MNKGQNAEQNGIPLVKTQVGLDDVRAIQDTVDPIRRKDSVFEGTEPHDEEKVKCADGVSSANSRNNIIGYDRPWTFFQSNWWCIK